MDGVLMNHMNSFEKSWEARHDLPAGTLKQYRFKDESGYRLPDLAKNYRTWIEAIDSVVVELSDYIHCDRELCIEAIEAAGIKVAP
jgi:hypothetical protein